MPQPDPWAAFRPQAAPQVPVQPQPFPGAAPVQVQVNPAKTQAVQNAAQQAVIQANQDRRGDAGVAMEAERLRMAKEEHDRKEAALAANGGIETHADENTAAALEFRMKRDLDMIKLIQAKHPDALQPGARETLGSLSSNQWVKDAAIPEHIRGPRLQLNNLYKDFVQNSIYAASGAAFNQSEMDTKLASLMPSYWDTPEVLQTKQYGLETEIGAAMLKSGAAQSKIDAAIQQFRDSAGQLYSKNSGLTTPMDQASPQTFQASDSKQAVQMNPDMQKEFEAWMGQHPPGTLTTPQFLSMYQALAKKYEYDLPMSSIAQAEDYVKGYNKGVASLEIPRPNRDLSETEAAIASGSNSAPGIFFKNLGNAGSFGLAELAAGAEGRRASQLGDAAHPNAVVAGEVIGSIAPVVGLESLAGRVAGHITEGALARKLATEATANGAYGAIRGANAAEPGHRANAAMVGGVVGAGSAVAARGVVKGARGFMGDTTRKAVDDLSSRTFEMPGERPALPADDITPPRYQGMGDDELRAEIARARQGIDAWGSQSRIIGENKAARQAILDEAQQTAATNANRQEVFVRQNFRSTQPGRIDAIRAEAARLYPTDPAEVMKQPEFASRMGKIVDPSSGSLEPLDILQARIGRLEEHLSQDAAPKTGTIPAVDLTTSQRAGLGAQEEALQGVPFVHGAREKAVESWNKQNSARVLAKIGEELPDGVRPGQDMNAYVNGQLNQAYNRIRPAINGKFDAPFDNAIAALRKNSVGQSAERQELWGQIEEALQKFRKPDGTFDGNSYREVSTQLRRLSDVWTSNNQAAMSTAAQDMARTAEQVRKQAQALVSRANPAAGRRLKQLENAWAHQVRIEAASRGAAKATRGVYTPDEYLNAIERLDTSRNKDAVARGRGLDQPYAQNAREIIGGKPAKKASIKETAVGAASLHFGGVPAATIVSGLSLGYVPGVKRLVQALVEGKLGATPKAVTRALQGSKVGDTFLKVISADARQKLLEQLIRVKAQKKTD